MSSLQAALAVAFGLVALAGPPLWWLFFREGHAAVEQGNEEPVLRMSEQDVRRIEASLQVTLPPAYASFLQERGELPDNTTVLDMADLIITCTMEYRAGAYGLPPWPAHFVYVGDEADACPYALDCINGGLTHLHKGNYTARPIARFDSFEAFLAITDERR